MATHDQVRRIERWRNDVADLSDGVSNVRISPPASVAPQPPPTSYTAPPSPRMVRPRAASQTTPVVKVFRHGSTRRSSPPPISRCKPQVVRVFVPPTYPDDRTARHSRKDNRSERSYPVATTATSQSRPTHYTTSREGSDQRSWMSPPSAYTRPVRSRRSPSPRPRFAVIKRALGFPPREQSARYDGRSYDEAPRSAPRYSRPRARSVVAHGDAFYPQEQRRGLSPYYYPEAPQPGRPIGRSATVRSTAGDRRKDDWVDRRFSQLYDDVARGKSFDARRPPRYQDDRGPDRRRSVAYDDYDYR